EARLLIDIAQGVVKSCRRFERHPRRDGRSQRLCQFGVVRIQLLTQPAGAELRVQTVRQQRLEQLSRVCTPRDLDESIHSVRKQGGEGSHRCRHLALLDTERKLQRTQSDRQLGDPRQNVGNLRQPTTNRHRQLQRCSRVEQFSQRI